MRWLITVCSMVMTSAALAAPAGAATPTPPDPLRPAGPLAVVGCQPGQVDFNRASAASISGVFQAVFGDPMPPVAKRVVSGRNPWFLDIEDLEVISGIGPGRVPALQSSGRVCLGFNLSGPPPVDLAGACRPGDGRIDANDPASRAALAKLVNASTADRIVADIPYGGVASIIAEHLSGVGKGNAKDIARLCVTPPTVTYGERSVTWTFAVKESGVDARSADRRSLLSVPSAALGGSDRWVRSEDIVASGAINGTILWNGDLTAVDARQWSTPAWDHQLHALDGALIQPAAQVFLSLAGDPDLKDDPDSEALIIHFNRASDDWTATTNAGLPASGGRAGAWLSHLSSSWLTYQPRTPMSATTVRIADGSAEANRQETLRQLYHMDTPSDYYANDGACDAAGGAEFSDPNLGFLFTLLLPRSIRAGWCTFFDETYGTWRVRNKRALPIFMSVTGNARVRGVSDDDNVLTKGFIENQGDTDASWLAWRSGSSAIALGPESVGDVQLLRHSDREDIKLSTRAGDTAKFLASNTILEAMGLDKSTESLVVRRILQCGYASNAVTCILSEDMQALFEELFKQGVIKVVGKQVAKKVITGYTVGKLILPVFDSGTENMGIAWFRPPAPTHTGNRRIPAGCAVDYSYTQWRWVIDTACVDAYYAGPGGGRDYIVNVADGPLAFVVRDGRNVGEFASGGDYICAAQSLLVRFVKGMSDAASYGDSSTRLRCPADVGGGGRDIPASDNVLLRMSDGTTYFKNSSTLVGIEHVLDGGCFERLAVDHLGYDYVTREEVQTALNAGWEIDDASAACQ